MVDLIGVVPADADKPTVVVPDAPATEMQVTDIVEGSGAEVEVGSIVLVHYVGVAQSTGEQFDASWDRGNEAVAPFQIGVGQVVPGWDEGLLGMKVGGQRELIIPPDLAYGEAGAGDGAIAPGETLVFVVDLVGVA